MKYHAFFWRRFVPHLARFPVTFRQMKASELVADKKTASSAMLDERSGITSIQARL